MFFVFLCVLSLVFPHGQDLLTERGHGGQTPSWHTTSQVWFPQESRAPHTWNRHREKDSQLCPGAFSRMVQVLTFNYRFNFVKSHTVSTPCFQWVSVLQRAYYGMFVALTLLGYGFCSCCCSMTVSELVAFTAETSSVKQPIIRAVSESHDEKDLLWQLQRADSSEEAGSRSSWISYTNVGFTSWFNTSQSCVILKPLETRTLFSIDKQSQGNVPNSINTVPAHIFIIYSKIEFQ